MRRGPWHQCGDRSQTIARELLEEGAGVGVIMSPRDLSFAKAVEYAEKYHDLGADVLIDPQFYIPQFSNNNLASYPTSAYRTTVSQLRQIGDGEIGDLAAQLQVMNEAVGADGVVAPAVVYQASSPGIAELNARLFAAARAVGEEMGLPTYATVALGRSAVASADTVDEVLSHATALEPDGWYFGFEFERERIPSSREAVYRCGAAVLTLACTGKPVVHAYAGPMALLSFAFGATGAGIGQNQNLWRFSPSRFQPPTGQGGGGGAPPRFFSSTLWGTIVHPDDTALLPRDLADRVLTPSPFIGGTGAPPPDWPRKAAHRHMVYNVCETVAALAEISDPREVAGAAQERLRGALRLYQEIAQAGVFPRDNPDVYQANWANALDDLLNQNQDDFEFLAVI